jgi:hypothetical protein
MQYDANRRRRRAGGAGGAGGAALVAARWRGAGCVALAAAVAWRGGTAAAVLRALQRVAAVAAARAPPAATCLCSARHNNADETCKWLGGHGTDGMQQQWRLHVAEFINYAQTPRGGMRAAT